MIPIIFGSLDFQHSESKQTNNFQWIKICLHIYRLNTKIRSTMLCLRGFKQYSRWVPLLNVFSPSKVVVVALQNIELLQTLEFINRGSRREYSSKLKHIIVERILVFKR